MSGWTRVRAALPLVVAAGVMTLTACDATAPQRGGRVSIYLTDAPGDVEAAWIRIVGINLIGESKQEVALSGDFADYIEVTELVGRAQQLVADEEVDLRTISEIRFVLGDAALLTKQGDVYATDAGDLPAGLVHEDEEIGQLHCPSCSESGLKIVLSGPPPAVEEGENVTILLDFDVAQSFGKPAGKSGKWVMHPVIHATLSAVPGDPMSGSSIGGTVSLGAGVTIPPCPANTPRSVADFAPTANAITLRDGDGNLVVRSAIVGADGSYTISGVEADTYEFFWLDQQVGDATTGDFRLTFSATPSPEFLVIGESGEHTVDYTITGASCMPL